MSASAAVSLATAFGVGSLVSLVSARLRVPAALPLLAAGMLLGPYGAEVVDSATLGEAFPAIVDAAIGLLVFEGCLYFGVRELGIAPRAILGLLTVGAAVTAACVAMAGHWLIGLPWEMALVLGAILIVTGPTVVQPILRRLNLTRNLQSSLGAEGVLIDPIGVVATVVMLNGATAVAEGADPGLMPLVRGLLEPLFAGGAVGAAVGSLAFLAHAVLVRMRRRHEGELGMLGLAACMLAVAAGNAVISEGGLVAAAVAGVVLAHARGTGARDLRELPEHLATIVVGMLFVLVASRVEPRRILELDTRGWLFVAAVIFLIRPLSVLLGTATSRLHWNERAFAALFAPRGIVAASTATIATQRFAAVGDPATHGADPAQIETLVFATIAASVAWVAITAGPLSKLLRVAVVAPPGVLLVGAHRLARETARVLQVQGVPVRLVDSNAGRVLLAAEHGLEAMRGDATDPKVLHDLSPGAEIGWVLAWTGNEDVDRAAIRWASERFGEGHGQAIDARMPAPPDGEHGDSASLGAAETGAAAEEGPSDRRTRLSAIEDALDRGEVVVAAAPTEGMPWPIVTVREGAVVAIGRCTTPREGDVGIGLLSPHDAAALMVAGGEDADTPGA